MARSRPSITVIGEGTSSSYPERARVTLIITASGPSQRGAQAHYCISPIPDYSEVRPSNGDIATYHYQTEARIIFRDIYEMKLVLPELIHPPDVYLLCIEWFIGPSTMSMIGARARQMAMEDAGCKAEEYANHAFGEEFLLMRIKEIRSTCEHPQNKPRLAKRHPRYAPSSLTPVKFVYTVVLKAKYRAMA
ncbi:hypothetical protein N7461_003588 [Penicillium sp. DV-2018c]|nr:hypothetical protein N7461_003588 [Penicillium sp. DV-2018c]